tara:strand:- start:2235 stop:2459 length:225 start_codon:yes stop_codon:yes gene_type:complete
LVLNGGELGIDIVKGETMPKKGKKEMSTIQELEDRFDADISPAYPKVSGRFHKQGKRSFIDDFYSLYRRWVKNE